MAPHPTDPHQQIARLQALSHALSPVLTEAEVITAVLAHASLFEADAGLVALRRGDSVEIVVFFGSLTHETIDPWRVHPLGLDTVVTRTIREAEQLFVPDLASLLEEFPSLAGSGPSDGAWLGLPLLDQGEALGALCLRFLPSRPVSQDRIDYLSLLAHPIGLSLGRAALVRELRARADHERRLLGIVGHDLRTPLTAITYAAALLPRDGQCGELAERIERSARRMSHIIQRANGLSFGRAFEQPLVSVEALVHDQLDELRAAFPGRQIALESPGVTLLVDPGPIGQILANLVRNALEYGAPGQPVTVRLDRPSEELKIAVHNHNRTAPIPIEQQRQLFDAFSRGPSTHGEGLGLGLFIVREFSEKLGGRVELTSDASGTEFRVLLPADAPGGP